MARKKTAPTVRPAARVSVQNAPARRDRRASQKAELPGRRRARPAPKPPRPGTPVRGSTTGRPVMALLDLLGRRWVLRIVWELRDTPLTFRALREAADGVSPSVLNGRLAELKASALVEGGPDGYALTPLGRELLGHLMPLLDWSLRWSAALRT